MLGSPSLRVARWSSSRTRCGTVWKRAGRDTALSEEKSDKLRVRKARDRAAGRLLDRGLGGRDRATLERLLARLKRRGVRLDCADGREACAGLIPRGRLPLGKEGAPGIERRHARRPHRPARSRRRSIVVSEAVRTVDASTALLVRF